MRKTRELHNSTRWDFQGPQPRLPFLVVGRAEWITSHALKQVLERYPDFPKGELGQKHRLQTLLANAGELELKPKFRKKALLAHLKPAAYFCAEANGQRYVFVIEDDTVKTVHKGTANRWRWKP